MNYDVGFLQTAMGQVGVLCVAAGVAQIFFIAGTWHLALGLSAFGIMLILVGSIRREIK